jgi:DNA modification methylase
MSPYKPKRIISEKNIKKLKNIDSIKNKIIHGDTLSTLKNIPDNSIQLVVTSPSYFLGKKYEINQSFEDYLEDHRIIIKECHRVLKDDGAIFWNVAQSVIDKEVIHLGSHFYNIFKDLKFFLRNWIIWKFEGGECPRTRLFGRYENILWFVKNINNYIFNLDDVRVPTKWINDKRVRKDGKNPEDFWEFDTRKNIEKVNSLKSKISDLQKLMSEKTDQYVNQILMDEIFRDMERSLDYILDTEEQIIQKNLNDNIWHINRVVNVSKSQKIKHPVSGQAHPCPFPEELITRIVKMSSNEGDTVLDIFSGSGTVFKVSDSLNRSWIGIEKEMEYCEISDYRYSCYKREII